MVSLLLIATLPSSSTRSRHGDQSSQLAKPLASPTALPSAKPAGLLFFFSAWQSLRKPAWSFGISSKPASLTADLR